MTTWTTRILEFIYRFGRAIVVPAYLIFFTWYALNTYFDHEKHKAIMEGQIKLMCIQAHACGDDCKDI